ncbi:MULTISPECIES: GIY-YIG nuclease family protein [unclassified Sulfitobacter]|uniref:GIY-YIG nuclease family protein n=1 Tax=Sulfitobacter phage pCB2047-A TaxID=754045 RepID=UPI0002C0ECEE|nr:MULTISPECIES: GIY-YIG nuclease family protein [unclassified Sulfitobacter]YP_007675418.1 GIY-YIG nuclease family protein [Sulfitobacter phage pCB2047-A]YP_009146220.1 GIY-YIG nuclease family protein [Sulfitobacter phage NYA-2014a]AGH30752.1 T5orf172 domain-containing protein [Sulfitobacter phage pCB2047-A]AIM40677.1 T5ord172-domain containing protein [Sulfitobacter phage NYA-2014a]PTA99599.1 hypothetical protein C8254_14330 [Sulfitobacter sp. CB-A]ULO21250.1 GIY-YIG nuclease family protein
MSRGYVYVLSNPSMPGLVKIGRTIRCVNGRANELYQTGVPTPFRVDYSILSPNCEELEIRAHEKFQSFRVNEAREFFNAPYRDVAQYLEDEQRYQVECLIEEFIPDHTIVYDAAFVDLGGMRPSFYQMASSLGLSPPDMVSALYQLEGEEAAPAIRRAKEKTDERIAAYKAAKEAGETPA